MILRGDSWRLLTIINFFLRISIVRWKSITLRLKVFLGCFLEFYFVKIMRFWCFHVNIWFGICEHIFKISFFFLIYSVIWGNLAWIFTNPPSPLIGPNSWRLSRFKIEAIFLQSKFYFREIFDNILFFMQKHYSLIFLAIRTNFLLVLATWLAPAYYRHYI